MLLKNDEVIYYSIQNMPEEERPRERLARFGPEAIATAELIAIILGSGTKSVPVMQLAQDLVAKFGTLSKLSEATISELCEVKGVGPAKAIQLKAAFALGMRASKQAISPKYRIEHPVHAYQLVRDEIERETREFFIVIMQDIKGYVIAHEVISIGNLANTLVHPREVFYPAIRNKAYSIIAVHNHPSGDPTPSPQDYELTKELVEAGKLIGIPLYDHLIVGLQTYISLRQKGFAF